MRVSIYQDSPRRARLVGLLFATLAAGCRAPGPVAAAVKGSGTDASALAVAALDGRSLHFTRLQVYAPDTLLEFHAGKTSASTAQIGDVAVSEVERSYSEGTRTAKIRILDTSLNRGARAPNPGPAFEDDQKVGRPLRTAGANGYVEFEKESRKAVANLIVADRVLVTVTFENAKGPEDVERLAAAMDLRSLETLLRQQANP
jgi:hypothetical protein